MSAIEDIVFSTMIRLMNEQNASVEEHTKLLKKQNKLIKEQTEIIKDWQNMDEKYHNKTLEKLS